MIIHHKHILMVSSCSETWGGSEELWNNLVHHSLLKDEKKVSLYKDEIDTSHPKINALKASGVNLYSITNTLSFIKKLAYKLLIAIKVPYVDRYKTKYLLHKIFRIQTPPVNTSLVFLSEAAPDPEWDRGYSASFSLMGTIAAGSENARTSPKLVCDNWVVAH